MAPSPARTGLARARLLRATFVTQFAIVDAVTSAWQPWNAPRFLEVATALSLGVAASLADRSRPWRLFGAFAAASYVVAELLFYRYYHACIDARVVESLVFSWHDVWPVLVRVLPIAAVAALAVAALEYWMLAASTGIFDARRPMIVGAVAVTLSIAVARPAWGVTRELFSRRDEGGGRAAVEELPSTRTVMPNILVLLTESVRASDYCTDTGVSCATSPEVDRLLPDRVRLSEMRSVASYTTVSVAALFTGRPPLGTHSEVAARPGLFDLMKSVRVGGRAPAVAYWSAQTASVFWHGDMRRTVDSFVTVDDLVGHAVADEDEVINQGVDRLLAAYAERHMSSLPKPFVLVLHFQGTHAPYFVHDSRPPFLPMSHTVTWSGLDALHNAYRDAIVEQDRSVARTVRAFFDRVGKDPYFILFTSDHGEAFGEHHAIHHGQDLYDEQIHVPAWVAAGNGALDGAQLENLESYRHALVTHLDVLPTLLDVAGVLDGYAAAGLRKRWPGRSLLAPHRAIGKPIPMTNCTALFPCPLETWGVLDEKDELVAEPWDADFRCVPLGPGGRRDAADCAALRAASRAFFSKKPNGASNL